MSRTSEVSLTERTPLAAATTMNRSKRSEVWRPSAHALTRALAGASWVLLGLPNTGCSWPEPRSRPAASHQSPTPRPSEQLPHTGKSQYDHVFERIGELGAAIDKSEVRRVRSRAQLARSSGLPSDCSERDLSEALRRRTWRWATSDLKLRLDFSDMGENLESTPQAELSLVSGSPRPYQQRTIEAITRAAQNAATTYGESTMGLRERRSLSLELIALTEKYQKSPPDKPLRATLKPALKLASRLLLTSQRRLIATLRETETLIAILEESANTEEYRAIPVRSPPTRSRSQKKRAKTSSTRSTRSTQRPTKSTPRPTRPHSPAAAPRPPTVSDSSALDSAPDDFQP